MMENSYGLVHEIGTQKPATFFSDGKNVFPSDIALWDNGRYYRILELSSSPNFQVMKNIQKLSVMRVKKIVGTSEESIQWNAYLHLDE